MFGREFDSSFSLPFKLLLLVPPYFKPIRIGELVCTQVKDIIQAPWPGSGGSNASQQAKAGCETVEERNSIQFRIKLAVRRARRLSVVCAFASI